MKLHMKKNKNHKNILLGISGVLLYVQHFLHNNTQWIRNWKIVVQISKAYINVFLRKSNHFQNEPAWEWKKIFFLKFVDPLNCATPPKIAFFQILFRYTSDQYLIIIIFFVWNWIWMLNFILVSPLLLDKIVCF